MPTRLLKYGAIMLFIGASLTGCQKFHLPEVFKIDIAQGNIVTTEDLEQLQAGMTPAQIEYILGSPLIKDPFHPQRWDYVFTYKIGKGDQETVTQKIQVLFQDGIYAEYKGVIIDSAIKQAKSKKLERLEQEAKEKSKSVENQIEQ